MAFNVRVKSKRDTHQNWTSNNPILLDGEIIIVDIDGEVRQKIGNGVSTYSALPFVDASVRESIDTHIGEIVSSDSGVHGFRLNEGNKSLDFLSADRTTLFQIPLYIVD